MSKVSITEIFFDLIKVAIGTLNANDFGHAPTEEEWEELYALANKQTLTGIVFDGITKLPAEKRPGKALIIKLHIACEQIKSNNRRMNHAAERVSQKFASEGFPNTILKGQGVAQLYPNPLLRTAGDIDIWLHGDKEKIISYVKGIVPDCKPVYHHVDFPVNNDVEIEIHFTPSWMNCYFTNRKLQRFFIEQQKQQPSNYVTTAEGDTFPAATNSLNRIYILQHIYRHLFHDGIGLRQLLDYHMVLCSGFTQKEKEDTQTTLKKLRLIGFAGACMYVLRRVFGTKEEYLITEPDEEQGEFLLNEIMLAGNFGKYDKRAHISTDDSEIYTFTRRVRRNLRFIKYHPTEVVWTPLFKIWHFFWRMKHK